MSDSNIEDINLSPRITSRNTNFSQVTTAIEKISKFLEIRQYFRFFYDEIIDGDGNQRRSSKIGVILSPKAHNANMFVYESADGKPIAAIIIYVGDFFEGGKDMDPSTCLVSNYEECREIKSSILIESKKESDRLIYVAVNFTDVYIEITQTRVSPGNNPTVDKTNAFYDENDKNNSSSSVSLDEVPPNSAVCGKYEDNYSRLSMNISKKLDDRDGILFERATKEKIKISGIRKEIEEHSDSVLFGIYPQLDRNYPAFANTEKSSFKSGRWKSGKEIMYVFDEYKDNKRISQWLPFLTIQNVIAYNDEDLSNIPSGADKYSINKLSRGKIFSTKENNEKIIGDAIKICSNYSSGFRTNILSINLFQKIYLPSIGRFFQCHIYFVKDSGENGTFFSRGSYDKSTNGKTDPFIFSQDRQSIDSANSVIGYETPNNIFTGRNYVTESYQRLNTPDEPNDVIDCRSCGGGLFQEKDPRYPAFSGYPKNLFVRKVCHSPSFVQTTEASGSTPAVKKTNNSTGDLISGGVGKTPVMFGTTAKTRTSDIYRGHLFTAGNFCLEAGRKENTGYANLFSMPPVKIYPARICYIEDSSEVPITSNFKFLYDKECGSPSYKLLFLITNSKIDEHRKYNGEDLILSTLSGTNYII